MTTKHSLRESTPAELRLEQMREQLVLTLKADYGIIVATLEPERQIWLEGLTYAYHGDASVAHVAWVAANAIQGGLK